jgi:DNA polymerase III alpha subunit
MKACETSSVHAAGVVIADKPLTEYVPYNEKQMEKIVTNMTYMLGRWC